MELSEVVAGFRRWLHLPDPGALYVILGTIAANKLPGDPVWLLLVGPSGGGKCLGPETPVLRYDGRVVRAEDVRVGDQLMGPDGQPRTVLGTTQGYDEMYRIVPTRGEEWRCNSVHVLTLKHHKTGEVIDVALNEYLAWSRTKKKQWRLFQADPLSWRGTPEDPRRVGRSFRVEACGVGRYVGFSLDGDGRFLLGDFTVTHNTELSNSLGKLPFVWPVATITEAGLLSGTPKKDRTEKATGGLLAQIGAFGIIVCKDFTSILSMPREARATVLAALREVYDGNYPRTLGTDGGQQLVWSGKVGLIAVCTPHIDTHHQVISTMGERFVMYRLTDIDDVQIAEKASETEGFEAQMRTELSALVRDFVEGLDFARRVDPPAEHVKTIQRLAVLTARCRSGVDRNPYTREVEVVPQPEAPGRLTRVFRKLYQGMVLTGVTPEDALVILTRIAFDCMPSLRRVSLEAVVQQEYPVPTRYLAARVGFSVPTVRRALEDLEALGVIQRVLHERARKGDGWELSPWGEEYILPFCGAV